MSSSHLRRTTLWCILICLISITYQITPEWDSGFLSTTQCLSTNVTQLLTASLTDLDTGRHVQQIEKGGNYRFTANFITQRVAIKRLALRLTLLIGTSEIRLPFFRKRNFCHSPASRIECPLLPNRVNTFQLSVHIPAQTPSFNGTLQMKLLNENRERILCTLFPLIVE